MGLNYNSSEVKELYYNAQQVGQVKFNNSIIWKYAPAVPTFTLTTVDDNSITVNFTGGRVKDSLRYRIAYGVSSNPTSTITTTNNNSYTFSGLSANTTYYFKIRAEGTWDNSVYTSVQNTTTAPSIPSSLTVSTYDIDSLLISFSASTGATRYYIDRRTGSGGSWAAWQYITTTSVYNHSLSINTTYEYRIRAYSANGMSRYSSIVSGTTGKNPSSTTITSITNGISNISLGWLAVTGATGYQLYRSNSSSGPWTLVTTTASTSFNNTGLTPNVTYYYKVRAYISYSGTDGISAFSSTVSRSTTVQLSVPAGLTATDEGADSISVSWNAVSNRSSYNVQISTSTSFSSASTATTTSTSYTFTSLGVNTTYYIRVRAVGTGGYITSSYSSYIEAATSSTPMNTPTGLTTTKVEARSVDFQWNHVNDLLDTSSNSSRVGYVLEKSETLDFSYTVNYDTGGDNFKLNVYMDRNSTCYFRVKAYDQNGFFSPSQYSSVITVTTPREKIVTPTNFHLDSRDVSGGVGTYKIDWNAYPTDGFTVQIARNSSFTSAAIINLADGSSSDYTYSTSDIGSNVFVRVKNLGTGDYQDSEWSETYEFSTLPPGNAPSLYMRTQDEHNRKITEGGSSYSRIYTIENVMPLFTTTKSYFTYGESCKFRLRNSSGTVLEEHTEGAKGSSVSISAQFSYELRAGETYTVEAKELGDGITTGDSEWGRSLRVKKSFIAPVGIYHTEGHHYFQGSDRKRWLRIHSGNLSYSTEVAFKDETGQGWGGFNAMGNLVTAPDLSEYDASISSAPKAANYTNSAGNKNYRIQIRNNATGLNSSDDASENALNWTSDTLFCDVEVNQIEYLNITTLDPEGKFEGLSLGSLLSVFPIRAKKLADASLSESVWGFEDFEFSTYARSGIHYQYFKYFLGDVGQIKMKVEISAPKYTNKTFKFYLGSNYNFVGGIDWGDSTQYDPFENPSNVFSSSTGSFEHEYTNDGTYEIIVTGFWAGYFNPTGHNGQLWEFSAAFFARSYISGIWFEDQYNLEHVDLTAFTGLLRAVDFGNTGITHVHSFLPSGQSKTNRALLGYTFKDSRIKQQFRYSNSFSIYVNYMFKDCHSLEVMDAVIDGPITSALAMFESCYNLHTLSNFTPYFLEVSEGDIARMFYKCHALPWTQLQFLVSWKNYTIYIDDYWWMLDETGKDFEDANQSQRGTLDLSGWTSFSSRDLEFWGFSDDKYDTGLTPPTWPTA